MNDQKPQLVGVWLYPIYFDFLPTHRLAKVLHLIKWNDNRDPCLSHPCGKYQVCHRLLNEPTRAVCLCQSNFGGKGCSIENQLCQDNYCVSNGLCKPNYRGLMSGNASMLYYLCPLNRLGDRCQLNYDLCDGNPCLNNGTCLPTSQMNSYFCLCTEELYGNKCQLKKRTVHININSSIDSRVALVQYFDINFYTLNLIFVHQHLYDFLLDVLFYIHEQTRKAPAVTIVKLYSNTRVDIYLVSLQIEVEFIKGTTEVTERTRCPHVNALLPDQTEIFPIQYHYICRQNTELLCFVDEWYLCVCDLNHSRVECFGYDHSLDRCSECLTGGRCVKGDPSKGKDFRCLCPQCYSGRRCQFSAQQLSFTLDSMIGEDRQSVQSIYFILSVLMFSVGILTNYASFLTFKRPTPRNFGVGYYLLVLSIFNQSSLLCLVLKTMSILFKSLMTAASCKTFSFILSVFARYTYWLTTWVTLERLAVVLFPFNTRLRKPRLAILIMIISFIVHAIMHIHEFLFFNIDYVTSEQASCVTNYSSFVWSYNYGNVLVQHLVPFCIQIISITILIVFAARSRSRSTKNREGFFLILQRQFNLQKELYITSLVLVSSALPQIIISSSFSCINLSAWQRYLLCAAYFFSYLPQVLGFILFVLPSTAYSTEFRQTQFGKMCLFNLQTKKKKQIAA